MIEPNFDKDTKGGLVPAVVQDYETGEVLMLAYMNREAWLKTLATGKATYWSRSRQSLWVKGEQSGHVQLVKEIRLDCDEDAILLKVQQVGEAACHTGHRSCFYRTWADGTFTAVGERVFDPKDVYP
jgi:phosphoribosyl-AMP cyclohydrolase